MSDQPNLVRDYARALAVIDSLRRERDEAREQLAETNAELASETRWAKKYCDEAQALQAKLDEARSLSYSGAEQLEAHVRIFVDLPNGVQVPIRGTVADAVGAITAHRTRVANAQNRGQTTTVKQKDTPVS